MSDQPAMLPLPLATFVRRLRAAGFAVDAGREFQLRRVLYARGSDYIGRFAELKYLLGPYVVTTPAEQARFYQLWDDYVRELEERARPRVPGEDPGGEAAAEPPRQRLLRRLLGALLVAGLIAGWLYYVYGTATPHSDLAEVALSPQVGSARGPLAGGREGDTLRIRNATKIVRPRDSIGFEWIMRDLDRDSVLFSTDAFHFARRLPPGPGRRIEVRLVGTHFPTSKPEAVYTLEVGCGNPPDITDANVPGGDLRVDQEYPFTLRPAAGVAYVWAFSDDTLRVAAADSPAEEAEVRHRFTVEGPQRVELRAFRPENPDHCFTVRTFELRVGTELPILPFLALRRDEPSQLATVGIHTQFLLWGGCLGLILLLRHRLRRRKGEETDEPEADYPIYDEGPYSVPYRDRAGQISVPADFYRIADQLRMREAGARMEFDGRATVNATVRGGGFPRWRERNVHRPVYYLVLLRHRDEFNQRDRLLRRLTDFLTAREAELTVYYHGGNFDHFWNGEHPKGWTPAQLLSRYDQYRLLVLGDGHGLVDPYATQVPQLRADRRRWLLRWARRLLVTTEPAADWSAREVLLHEHFPLYPATVAGLREGVAALNEIEEYAPLPYPSWEARQQRRYPEPSYRYRRWDSVADHRDYLAADPELFRWLAALAVVSQPDWNLTIAIGRALGLEVTHDRLLVLSRIPWLAANAPDHDLRLAFLAQLPEADERAARAAVVEELNAVHARVAHSFAETDWSTNLAVQSFALHPRAAANQRRVEELLRAGLFTRDQLRELDATAARSRGQAKPREATETDATPNLTELLTPEPDRRVFTPLNLGILGILLAGLAVLASLSTLAERRGEISGPHELAWWQDSYVLADRAVELNNQAVLLANYALGTDSFSVYRQRLADAEPRIWRALDSARVLRGNDYPLADSNRVRFRYNRVAAANNWRARDSLRLDYRAGADLVGEATALYTETSERYADTAHLTLLSLHVKGLLLYQLSAVADTTAGLEGYFDLAARDYELLRKRDDGFFDRIAAEIPVNLETLILRARQRPDTVVAPPPPVAPVPGLEAPPLPPVSVTLTGRIVDADGREVELLAVSGVDQRGNSSVSSSFYGGSFIVAFPFAGGVRKWTLNFTIGNLEYEFSYQGGLPRDGNFGDLSLRNLRRVATTTNREESYQELLERYRDYPYYQEEIKSFPPEVPATELTGVNLTNRVPGGMVYNIGDERQEGVFLAFGDRSGGGPPLPESLAGLKSQALLVQVTSNRAEEYELPQIRTAARRLALRLKGAGFEVTELVNPSRLQLEAELRRFVTVADPEGEGQLLISVMAPGDARTATWETAEGSPLSPEWYGYSLKMLKATLAQGPRTHHYVSLSLIDRQALIEKIPLEKFFDKYLPGPQDVVIKPGRIEDATAQGEAGRILEVPRPFRLATHEVSSLDYARYELAPQRKTPDAEVEVSRKTFRDPLPILAYLNGLSRAKGFQPAYDVSDGTFTFNPEANGYRLPTAEEWEYAARAGGETNRWSGTDDPTALYQYANLSPPRDFATSPNYLLPNAWGLYSMTGGVWEAVWNVREQRIELRGGSISDTPEQATLTRVLPVSALGKVGAGLRIAQNL